jgi:hypothetical protein
VRLFCVVPLTVAAVLIMFAQAAGAQVFDCSKQEDVAALDQYCQPIQTPGGGAGAGALPPRARARPPSVVKRLQAAGELGKTLLDLARVAPANVVRTQAGGRTQQVLDADQLLASGALGTPMKPESAGRAITKTAALGEGFAPTFRWALLLTTVLLVGASWLRYRAHGRPPR